MTARINTLRNATAARIGQLVLPSPITISAKPFRVVTTDDCREMPLVTVNGSAQQLGRDSRGSARHQPIIIIVVHSAIPTDASGDPDPTLLDLAIELSETLAIQLMSRFPDLDWARPATVEIPRLFDPNRLNDDGLYQSGILITFETDVEASA